LPSAEYTLGLPLELPGRVTLQMDMELVPAWIAAAVGELHLELHLLL